MLVHPDHVSDAKTILGDAITIIQMETDQPWLRGHRTKFLTESNWRTSWAQHGSLMAGAMNTENSRMTPLLVTEFSKCRVHEISHLQFMLKEEVSPSMAKAQ